jgi:hypothetical protein
MAMCLNDDQLQEVKNLAALFYTPAEIALMMDFIETDFEFDIINKTGPLYKAYQGGRLQSEMELRNSIIRLAKQGSSPAQTAALKIYEDSKIKMIDR